MVQTKYLKKILVSFIIIVSSLTVSATKTYAAKKEYDINETDRLYTDSIVTHQNDINNNEITICTYGCSKENMGFNGAQCGNENEKFSRITYSNDDSIQNKWNIEMNIYMYPVRVIKKEMGGVSRVVDKTEKSKVYNFAWPSFGKVIPKNGIYYEEPINNGKVNEGWEKTTAYEDLQNSFICPQYFYYDHTLDAKTSSNDDNNMELCYANSTDKCKSRDEKKYTKFSYANALNYSFIEELSNVFEFVNNDIKTSDKTSFLLKYYATENDICTVLNRYSGTQLVHDLENDNFVNYINNSFKTHTQSSPNAKYYTYETLSKIKVNFGDNINKKYDDISINYSNKLSESVEYYMKKCNPEVSEEMIDSYRNEVTNEMTAQINKISEEYTKKLNYDNLTCDDLLGDVAEMISTAYFILEIAAIVIAVALTILDYAKVILSDGQDAMKKTNQKLLKRLIIVVVILLLPALINLILTVFNIENFNSDNPLCKINK